MFVALKSAGLSWPLPPELDDGALEARLFPKPLTVRPIERPEPDWPTIHAEMKRKGVTLTSALAGVSGRIPPTVTAIPGSAIFIASGAGGASPVMRQVHQAGDKLFVDFAGHHRSISISPTARCARLSSLSL